MSLGGCSSVYQDCLCPPAARLPCTGLRGYPLYSMSISREELKNRVTKMVEKRNYVGAYMAVKQSALAELDRTEIVGEMASAIVDELSSVTRRQERERAIYLRSILAWIFRDFPGLSSLYREQVRLVHNRGDIASDMYQGFKNINDVASGRKAVSEGIEETVDQVRQNLEDAAESFRAGDTSESFRSFVSAAETGIRDSLTQMGRLFEGLNSDRSANRDSTRSDPDANQENDEVGEMRRRDESEAEDYEDVRFREADSSDSPDSSSDDRGGEDGDDEND